MEKHIVKMEPSWVSFLTILCSCSTAVDIKSGNSTTIDDFYVLDRAIQVEICGMIKEANTSIQFTSQEQMQIKRDFCDQLEIVENREVGKNLLSTNDDGSESVVNDGISSVDSILSAAEVVEGDSTVGVSSNASISSQESSTTLALIFEYLSTPEELPSTNSEATDSSFAPRLPRAEISKLPIIGDAENHSGWKNHDTIEQSGNFSEREIIPNPNTPMIPDPTYSDQALDAVNSVQFINYDQYSSESSSVANYSLGSDELANTSENEKTQSKEEPVEKWLNTTDNETESLNSNSGISGKIEALDTNEVSTNNSKESNNSIEDTTEFTPTPHNSSEDAASSSTESLTKTSSKNLSQSPKSRSKPKKYTASQETGSSGSKKNSTRLSKSPSYSEKDLLNQSTSEISKTLKNMPEEYHNMLPEKLKDSLLKSDSFEGGPIKEYKKATKGFPAEYHVLPPGKRKDPAPYGVDTTNNDILTGSSKPDSLIYENDLSSDKNSKDDSENPENIYGNVKTNSTYLTDESIRRNFCDISGSSSSSSKEPKRGKILSPGDKSRRRNFCAKSGSSSSSPEESKSGDFLSSGEKFIGRNVCTKCRSSSSSSKESESGEILSSGDKCRRRYFCAKSESSSPAPEESKSGDFLSSGDKSTRGNFRTKSESSSSSSEEFKHEKILSSGDKSRRRNFCAKSGSSSSSPEEFKSGDFSSSADKSTRKISCAKSGSSSSSSKESESEEILSSGDKVRRRNFCAKSGSSSSSPEESKSEDYSSSADKSTRKISCAKSESSSSSSKESESEEILSSGDKVRRRNFCAKSGSSSSSPEESKSEDYSSSADKSPRKISSAKSGSSSSSSKESESEEILSSGDKLRRRNFCAKSGSSSSSPKESKSGDFLSSDDKSTRRNFCTTSGSSSSSTDDSEPEDFSSSVNKSTRRNFCATSESASSPQNLNSQSSTHVCGASIKQKSRIYNTTSRSSLPRKPPCDYQTLTVNPKSPRKSRRHMKILSSFGKLHSYAGVFNVNKLDNTRLFFWFFCNENWKNTPLIVWLQGEPGLTSLYGLFMEHGPYYLERTEHGFYDLKLRKYSWTRKYSVLYLDHCAQCGFSSSEDPQSYTPSYDQVARNVYEALSQFFKVWYEMVPNDLYLAGSYGGAKYIPVIAQTIHDENEMVFCGQKMNLKGLIIGGPYADSGAMVNYNDYLLANGIIDETTHKDLIPLQYQAQELIRAGKYQEAIDFLELHVYCLMSQAGYQDYTDVRFLKTDELENMANVVQSETFASMICTDEIIFENRSKETLIAEIMPPVETLVPKLLKNYKILYYNGQFDMMAPYMLTSKALLELEWESIDQFYATELIQWRSKQNANSRLEGYYRNFQNLTHVMVRNSGHFVGTTNSRSLYYLLKWFVEDKFQRYHDNDDWYN